jgi:hypothetical protein
MFADITAATLFTGRTDSFMFAKRTAPAIAALIFQATVLCTQFFATAFGAARYPLSVLAKFIHSYSLFLFSGCGFFANY